MKILKIISIGLITVLSIGCDKKTPTDPQKVKIKSMAVFWQKNRESGESFTISDTVYLKYHIEYDSLGNLVHEVINGGDVFDNSYYHNQYDKSGLLISRHSTYGDSPKINSRDTFIYNVKRQLVKEIEIGQSNDTIGVTEYTYNDSGQILSKKEREVSDYTTSYSYKYAEGKLTEEANDFVKTFYSYSPNGNLLAEATINIGKSDTAWTVDYRYNYKNYLKSRTIKYKDTLYKVTFYDSKGLILSELTDKTRLIYRYELWD
jgi:hypothetical protein